MIEYLRVFAHAGFFCFYRRCVNPQGYADRIVQSVREPLLVLDCELRVAASNRAFDNSFQTTPDETAGRLLFELGNGQWDIPALRKMLADVLLSKGEFNDFEVARDFPHIGQRIMRRRWKWNGSTWRNRSVLGG